MSNSNGSMQNLSGNNLYQDANSGYSHQLGLGQLSVAPTGSPQQSVGGSSGLGNGGNANNGQIQKQKVSSHNGVEYKHSRVPRTKDLLQEYGHTLSKNPIKTLMVRNVPNRYTQRQFSVELNSLGFRGSYDFLYLPMDRSTESNVGYAFINFIDPADAVRALQVFGEYRFQR